MALNSKEPSFEPYFFYYYVIVFRFGHSKALHQAPILCVLRYPRQSRESQIQRR